MQLTYKKLDDTKSCFMKLLSINQLDLNTPLSFNFKCRAAIKKKIYY